MGAILIRCPTMNQLVPVGIDTDKDTFKKSLQRDGGAHCVPAVRREARVVDDGRCARHNWPARASQVARRVFPTALLPKFGTDRGVWS